MKSNRYNVIADFLEYIENIRRYSPHTVRSYRHDLEEYSDFCQNIEPKKDYIENINDSSKNINFYIYKNI